MTGHEETHRGRKCPLSLSHSLSLHNEGVDGTTEEESGGVQQQIKKGGECKGKGKGNGKAEAAN